MSESNAHGDSQDDSPSVRDSTRESVRSHRRNVGSEDGDLVTSSEAIAVFVGAGEAPGHTSSSQEGAAMSALSPLDADYHARFTDPGRLRVDPLERALTQLLGSAAFARIRALREQSLLPLSVDEMLQVASLVESEDDDRVGEFLAWAATSHALPAPMLAISSADLSMQHLLQSLRSSVAELQTLQLQKHGDAYTLELNGHLATVDADAEDNTLPLDMLVAAANSLLAKLGVRRRFVCLASGSREIYAFLEVGQAISLHQKGAIEDNLERAIALAAW